MRPATNRRGSPSVPAGTLTICPSESGLLLRSDNNPLSLKYPPLKGESFSETFSKPKELLALALWVHYKPLRAFNGDPSNLSNGHERSTFRGAVKVSTSPVTLAENPCHRHKSKTQGSLKTHSSLIIQSHESAIIF